MASKAAIPTGRNSGVERTKKKYETEFETLCFQLRQNNVDKVSFSRWLDILTDALAFQLAKSLQGNTSLQEWELIIGSDDVTMPAGEALVKALQSSAVKKLTFREGEYDEEEPYIALSAIGTLICTAAIQTVHWLSILNPLEAFDVKKLGKALNNNTQLQTLLLNLEEVKDKKSAMALLEGIQNSNVSRLELDGVWSHIGRTLLFDGIMSVPSLRHICMCERRDFSSPDSVDDEDVDEEGDEGDEDDEQYEDDDDDEQYDEDDYEHYEGYEDYYEDNEDHWGLRQMAYVTMMAQRAVRVPTPPPSPPRHVSQMESITLTSFKFLDFQNILVSEPLLGHSNLKKLTLTRTEIGDEGVQYLVDGWKVGLPQLETLDLKRNNIGIRGLLVLLNTLSSCPSLNHLNLAYNYKIGQEDPQEFENNEPMSDDAWQMEELDLSCCELKDRHMKLLRTRCLRNANVTLLDLGGNNIGDVGAKHLVDSMNRGLAIERLDLGGNGIGMNGFQQLLHASARHPDWKELNLRNNQSIGYRDLAIIARELASSHLSKLDNCNCIDDIEYDGDMDEEAMDEADLKQRELCDAACKALLAAVKVNFHLQSLNLRGMCIPQDVKDEIQVYLDVNKLGRRPFLQDEMVPALWPYLLAKCQDRSIVFLFLQEKPMLIPDKMRSTGGKQLHGDTTKLRKKRKRQGGTRSDRSRR